MVIPKVLLKALLKILLEDRLKSKDVIKLSWIERDRDNRLCLAIVIAVANYNTLLVLQNQNKLGGQTNKEIQISEDNCELLN